MPECYVTKRSISSSVRSPYIEWWGVKVAIFLLYVLFHDPKGQLPRDMHTLTDSKVINIIIE